jgi:spermidine synthase
VSWCPTARTRDSFVAAFPYVLLLGEVLVGSEGPIAFERERVRARLDDPFARDHYQRGGVDIARLVGDFIAHEALSYGPGVDRSLLLDVNRDLFPKDEYMVPRDAKANDATARSARTSSK